MSSSNFYPPLGYKAPSWPALNYLPFSIKQDGTSNLNNFLYGQSVVLQFTILWMLVCFVVFYGIAALVAYVAFFPKKRIFILVVLQLTVALIVASIAGSVIGKAFF